MRREVDYRTGSHLSNREVSRIWSLLSHISVFQDELIVPQEERCSETSSHCAIITLVETLVLSKLVTHSITSLNTIKTKPIMKIKRRMVCSLKT